MNPGLYICSVMHHRFAPKVHHLAYQVFYLALDLESLESDLARCRWLSLNRFNLFSINEKDYLPIQEPAHPAAPPASTRPAPESSLRDRVLHYLREHGIAETPARVTLVTMPRVLGYAFNPVSFYYAWDAQGRSLGAIVEVTNTFREIKPYFLGPDDRVPSASDTEGGFHRRVAKEFYVSPFSDVDVAFDFQVRPPGEKLAIQIDTYERGQRLLTSTLTGSRTALTDGRLAWFAVRFPFLSLAVMGRIHWHALLLWLKRVPWYAKAARASEQRHLYRPHSSIAPPPA